MSAKLAAKERTIICSGDSGPAGSSSVRCHASSAYAASRRGSRTMISSNWLAKQAPISANT